MATAKSELTGMLVDMSSAEWLHECECSWLLRNKVNKAEKHLHLYGVVDREELFVFNPVSGRNELADDWKTRVVTKTPPLMAKRGLAAADRLLADAKRLWEIRQEKDVT